jgi:antiviral helicase SKI2
MTHIHVGWVGIGEVSSYEEVLLPESSARASTSTSLMRAPAPLADFVRGSVGNLPFRPGGLDDNTHER